MNPLAQGKDFVARPSESSICTPWGAEHHSRELGFRVKCFQMPAKRSSQTGFESRQTRRQDPIDVASRESGPADSEIDPENATLRFLRRHRGC